MCAGNLKSELKSEQEKSSNLEKKSINLKDELKSQEVFLSELDVKIADLYERQLWKEKEDEIYNQRIETELEQLKKYVKSFKRI